MHQTLWPIITDVDVLLHTGPPSLRISTGTPDDTREPATLALAGELCLATVERAERRIRRWHEQIGHPAVLVDLTGVSFIDGRGLTLLVMLQQLCSASNRPLVVSAARTSPCVDRLLGLCDLTIRDGILVPCPVLTDLAPPPPGAASS